MQTLSEAPESHPDTALTLPNGVKRMFPDVRSLNRAVTRLTRRSVPVDEIHVYVLDREGKPKRELVVEDEAGTLGGALIGAVLGGILGVIIIALAQLSAFQRINDAIYGLDTIPGAFRLVAVLALIGVPVGGIINLGHWNARKKIGHVEPDAESFLVVVETEQLADLAQSVLDRVGGLSVPA